MTSWQVQDAKARFSELLEATIKDGPQVITRRGIEVAVLMAFDEWCHLQESARPGFKELLLGPGPRFKNLIPEHRRFRRRPTVEFQ